LETFREQVCSPQSLDSDLLGMEALVSPEFSGFFLDEFEDGVDFLLWPVKIFGRERVEC
jgi:hypothetical protein